jgi:hypothetical protein
MLDRLEHLFDHVGMHGAALLLSSRAAQTDNQLHAGATDRPRSTPMVGWPPHAHRPVLGRRAGRRHDRRAGPSRSPVALDRGPDPRADARPAGMDAHLPDLRPAGVPRGPAPPRRRGLDLPARRPPSLAQAAPQDPGRSQLGPRVPVVRSSGVQGGSSRSRLDRAAVRSRGSWSGSQDRARDPQGPVRTGWPARRKQDDTHGPGFGRR